MFGLLRRSAKRSRESRHVQLDRFKGTVWAVGDIHGCLRELLWLEKRIVGEAASFPKPHVIVYLGDYVDRGPHSEGVIRHLLAPPPPGFERYLLEGNHEALMRAWLEDPTTPPQRWLEVGGLDTLLSYGVQPPREEMPRWPKGLATKIPEAHRQFLDGLLLTVRINRCVFVHAGLREDAEIEDQSEQDLLWMRGEDQTDWAGGRYVVVHGHTIVEEPAVFGQRIAIDTGAYRTGRLTAVRLGAQGYRFITT